jgi:hypothetical protein
MHVWDFPSRQPVRSVESCADTASLFHFGEAQVSSVGTFENAHGI